MRIPSCSSRPGPAGGRAAAVRARVTWMVVVMVALFLICWGPVQVCILLQAFGFRSYVLYKVSVITRENEGNEEDVGGSEWM